MKLLLKLLLLNALAACGAPGSDDVFVGQQAKAPADSSASKAPERPRGPRYATRQYSGYFRRMNDTVLFQPCGSKTVLEVFATPQGRGALRDQYRFNTPWQGVTVFSVFNGAIVTDTVVSRGDSATAKLRTRFVVAGVDSMRARRDSDCGGMPPS